MNNTFWPKPHNQQQNLLRLKYVFENVDEALLYTPEKLQSFMKDYFEVITQTYGHLYVAFENPERAKNFWKLLLLKNEKRFLLKQKVNEITLDNLLTTTSKGSSSGNVDTNQNNEANNYIFNDQNPNENNVEGKKYKRAGQEGNAAANSTSKSQNESQIKSYNLAKIEEFLELSTAAEADLIKAIVNGMVASVQPTVENWDLERGWK